jgi:hypothetical protein
MKDVVFQVASTGPGADERRRELHSEVAAAINAALHLPCRYGIHVRVKETRDIRAPAPTLAEYAEGIANAIDLDITSGVIYTWNTGTGWTVKATARLRPPEQWNEPVVVNPNPEVAYYTR